MILTFLIVFVSLVIAIAAFGGIIYLFLGMTDEYRMWSMLSLLVLFIAILAVFITMDITGKI